jgi:glycosyltransferase involved in cell wall biosynthesis
MNKFKIVITSYNNENWTSLCVSSVTSQTYENYEVLFFNDGSSDKTLEVAKSHIKSVDERFKFFDLKDNNTKSKIFATMLDEHIDDNDIVLFLDGDDWLSSDEVLSAINQYYELNDCWVGYGGMVVWNGGEEVTQPYPQNSEFPIEITRNRDYRRDTWRSSHVKTMRGFIWKSIDKKDFLSVQDNQYILGPDDLVIMFDALEKCHPNKICRFDFPTYVYNHSQTNAARIQEHQKKRNVNYEAEIRYRPKKNLLPVVTSELSGGLGNQMFQVAACVSLAKRLGYVAMFDPDTHFLPLQGRKFETYKTNIFRKLITSKKLNIYHIYNSEKFNFTQIPNIQPFTIIKGGYQSEKYFDKKEIYKFFEIDDNHKKTLIEKYGDVSNKVSLHVRRGDYLKLWPHHVFVGEEYYTKAIQMMGDREYLVFSDDMDWCKEFFKGKFDFIKDEDYNEMYLMSMCKDNIIGNSTFSWWGAWLNRNPIKKVIAPKTWFGPGYADWDTKDLIPEGWVIL